MCISIVNFNGKLSVSRKADHSSIVVFKCLKKRLKLTCYHTTLESMSTFEKTFGESF